MHLLFDVYTHMCLFLEKNMLQEFLLSESLLLFLHFLVHSRFSINNYLKCKYVIKQMMINKLRAEITSFSYSLVIAIEITCAIISMCLIKSLLRE